MEIKRFLSVGQNGLNRRPYSLFLLVLIVMLLLPPWISTGEGKVTKTKRTTKKQTTTTATTKTKTKTTAKTALKVKDVSFKIEGEKEKFIVTLSRVYKPKVRYIKGASIHVVAVFSAVSDFEEKDYSQLIEGSKFVKKIRSYFEKDKRELRFVLDMNGSSDYSIAPVNGGSGNIFAVEIAEGKGAKSNVTDPDEEAPSE